LPADGTTERAQHDVIVELGRRGELGGGWTVVRTWHYRDQNHRSNRVSSAANLLAAATDLRLRSLPGALSATLAER
jgi:hypothetical protein